MDKKSNIRTTQLQSKAQAVDCKKSDGTSTKPWPRQNKKREGNGTTSKNESNRKNPTFQRGKGCDKRPRARSGDGFLGGKEDTRLADNEAELGSVFVQGSKKQNLNHLLNFQYAPRGSAPAGGVLTRTPLRRHGLVHSSIHPHNRELFLQSNCQFVVRADGDYSVHMLEPDLPVKWDQIEQIIVRSPSELACPVCLHTPVAGRITRCGHVYCWPCALHYLALADDTPGVSRSPPWRPCPVCAQAMDAKSLKSVKVYTQVYRGVGATMSMRLVRRQRGSTIVEPAPSRDGRRAPLIGLHLPSVSHQSEATQYAKLLTADLQEVKDILTKDRKELTDQVQAEIDSSEICFIEEALHLLKLREKELYTAPVKEVQKKKKINSTNDNQTNTINIVTQSDESSKNKITIDWFNVSGENGEGTPELFQPIKELKAEEVFEDFSSGTVPHMEVKSVLNPAAEPFVLTGVTTVEEDGILDDIISPGIELNDDLISAIDAENQAKYFYFYQASDGQAAFLHSVNVRLLSASWGSLVCAPLLIEGKLLRRESGSATTEVRRRMPCATHLPMHCPFDVVELELVPPDVTSQALDVFKEELVERARRRQKADREEKRREYRIRQQQEGQKQRAPNMSSLAHFPAAPHVDWQPLATSPDTVESVGSQASSLASKESADGSSQGMSFAKMASSQGVWTVRTPKQAAPPTVQMTNLDNVDGYDEDVLHAPPSLNLSDAITAALLNTSLKGTTEVASTSGGGKKKKKKQKAKVLFATGIQPKF